MFTEIENYSAWKLSYLSEDAYHALATSTLTFTDKASYVAWRAKWRALYATLSRQARKTWVNDGVEIVYNNSRELRRLMMYIRTESKKLAAQQYLLAHQV